MAIYTQKQCSLYVKWLGSVSQIISPLLAFLQSPSQMIRSKKLSLSSVSSKKREGRLWSTDSSLFPLISKSVKNSLCFHQSWIHVNLLLIVVFNKCLWGLNWPFRNVWAFTSRVTLWSVNCYYHKNRQQWFILQKEPTFAVKTVALFPLGVIWSHSVYYEPG